MTLEQRIAKARETGDTSGLVDIVPYYRFLGLTMKVTPEGPACLIPGGEKLVGNPSLPALHGGVIGDLLEATAIMHLIWTRDSVSLPKIINLTVEYLRSARPIETTAAASVTKLGRRVANVRVEAWQEDRAKPVASANALFLLT
jgi:acyl-coenzyme A thioesterase PaaI-like protein